MENKTYTGSYEKSYTDQNTGETLYTFCISNEEVDRGGDVMKVLGCDYTNYLNNPVIFYNHNSWDSYPIGLARKIYIQDTRLLMDIYFHELTDESKTVKTLIDNGIIKASSIGYDILEKPLRRSPTPEEQAKLSYWNNESIREVNRWELIELSIVNIPMNANALIQNGLTEIEVKKIKDILMKQETKEVPETKEPDTLETETKAGAAISKTNLEKIKAAHKGMSEVMNLLEELISVMEGGEEPMMEEEPKSFEPQLPEKVNIPNVDKDELLNILRGN